MITIVLFFIFVASILFEHFGRLRNYKWLQQFAGPPMTLPVFGDALQFLGHRSSKN